MKLNKTMKNKKSNAGRKSLPDNERKFRVTVLVSEIDVAQDNGVSRYIKAMN